MNFKWIIGLLILLGGIKMYLYYTEKMKDRDKFDWLPMSSAPELYPMNIHQGYLLYESPGGIYIPGSHMITDGWGESRTMHVVGEDRKPVPAKLSITFLSFLENKFYSGVFDLPKDRMTQLFREGFIDYRKRHETYKYIIVGMAPGGVVVVWMGGSGSQVEIGRYQATETEVTMEEWAPTAGKIEDKDAFIKRIVSRDTTVLKNFEENGIPFGLWDTYRERFRFRPVVRFLEPEGNETDKIDLEFLNGEQEILALDILKENAFARRARVKKIWLSWYYQGNILRESEIIFDETEIIEAFRFVTEGNPDCNVELVIRISEGIKRIGILLTGLGDDEDREFPLRKARIRNFKDEIRDER